MITYDLFLSLHLSLFFKIFIYLAAPGLSYWTTRETPRCHFWTFSSYDECPGEAYFPKYIPQRWFHDIINPSITSAALKLYKKKKARSLEEKLWQTQHIKKQRHDFADKALSSQSYGFSSGHVWMGALDHKESWALKNWCFWTVVLEKTLESPLDCKETQPVHPKGAQSWALIGRTDAKAETLILWPPDTESWLTGKDSDAGKDWRREEKRVTDDESGWLVSPTWRTWVWASSDSWWWTGKPGVLQSMGSQRVGHDWETEMRG